MLAGSFPKLPACVPQRITITETLTRTLLNSFGSAQAVASRESRDHRIQWSPGTLTPQVQAPARLAHMQSDAGRQKKFSFTTPLRIGSP